jgi:hypothetical protein
LAGTPDTAATPCDPDGRTPDAASPRWSTRRQQRSAMGAACGWPVGVQLDLVALPEVVAGGSSLRRRWLLQRRGACFPPCDGRLQSPGMWLGPCLRVGDAACRPHLGWRCPCRP